MPREPSRATISSLKATKTAHRMANEILNPSLELPQPVQPRDWQRRVIPTEPEADFTPRDAFADLQIGRREVLKVLAIIISAFVGLALIYAFTQR